MRAPCLTLGIASLLLLVCQALGAQTDTSEGGGEGNELQGALSRLETRIRALEAAQAFDIEQEGQDIQEEIREEKFIETHHRKLLELEMRVRMLESRMRTLSKSAGTNSGSPNGAPPSGGGAPRKSPANTAPPRRPRAQGAAAARSDLWRFRRFQGRWWYWMPGGQWVYWTGDRWAAPSTSPVKRS